MTLESTLKVDAVRQLLDRAVEETSDVVWKLTHRRAYVNYLCGYELPLLSVSRQIRLPALGLHPQGAFQ